MNISIHAWIKPVYLMMLVLLYPFMPCPAQDKSNLQIELLTGHPLNIIEPGKENELNIRLSTRENYFTSGNLEVQVSSFHGEEISFKKYLSAEPGEEIELDLPPQVFDRKGIYWVEYRFVSAERDTLKGRTSFAYMQTVGNDYHRDASSFKFGIAGIRNYSRESFEKQLMAAQLIGAAYERKYATWGQIQPREGEWNWESLDQDISTAERFGLERQLLISGSAPWAIRDKYLDHERKGNTPPRLGPWKNYVHALASRYRDRITYYEIWNEPDIGFYHGTTGEYLELLKSAYTEIKGVDPALQVMTGGFASAITRPSFLRERGDLHKEVIRKGQAYFDVHAFHRHSPFPRFRNELEGPLKEIREQLKTHKPLWFNETAMHSTEISEQEQARILFKKLTYGWAYGAIGYTWFNMLSSPNHPPSHHEHNYGMLTSGYTPKAVYVAYNELVTRLHDKQFVRRLETPEGYYAYLFTNGKQSVIASWREDETKPDLLFMVTGEGFEQVRLIDMMGNPETVPAYQNQVPVVVSNACRFVEIPASGFTWEKPAVEPVLSVGTEGFDLRLAKQGTGNRMITRLVYPPVEEDENASGYAVHSGRLPHFFQARLAWELPSAGWYGHLEIPVRLMTELTERSWKEREPDFRLSEYQQIINRYEHDPASAHLSWKGPEDLSAEGWFQKDGEQLTVVLKVTDDVFVKSSQEQQGDWVRLIFHDRLNDEIVNYQIEVNENDKAQVQYSGPDSRKREARASFSGDGKPIYEISIPVNMEILEKGLGYNVQIHDNDGTEVEGYIQLTPGIRVTDEPHYFPVLKLD